MSARNQSVDNYIDTKCRRAILMLYEYKTTQYKIHNWA